MLATFVRFENDSAGLEKTLRLLQSLCTVAIGLYGPAAIAADKPESLEPWVTTRAHFMLARRYFRLLKWYPCWAAAYAAMNREQSASRRMLEVLKFTFLGAYFFLEMFTITNMLGATSFSWGPRMQLEANKCWFYAIGVSILLSVYDIAVIGITSRRSKANDTEKPVGKDVKPKSFDETTSQATNEPKAAQQPLQRAQGALLALYEQLVIDACDLTIPGSAIGWLPVDATVVGTCSTISSVVAGRQIWKRLETAK